MNQHFSTCIFNAHEVMISIKAGHRKYIIVFSFYFFIPLALPALLFHKEHQEYKFNQMITLKKVTLKLLENI